MTQEIDNASVTPPSSGLAALILLLRFHGIAVEPRQITHQYGDAIGLTEMLRCAKDLKLKARCIESNWERQADTHDPPRQPDQHGQ